MPRPCFSVIIPVYNAARTLDATLDSVIAQDCQDFEIIAIDDGSTDDSAAVFERRAARDPRLTLIRQANAGVSAARNAGCNAARGTYLAFLDADDIWAPDKLSRHRRQFAADPGLAVAYAQIRFLTPAGAPTSVVSNRPITGIGVRDLLAENVACTTSNIVVLRAAFMRVGGFNTALAFDEDKEWLFRAFTAGEKLEGINAALTGYRTSPAGLASDLEQSWADWQHYVETVRPLAPEAVARAERLAGAVFLRNMARRALRLGVSPAQPLGLFLRALRRDPRVITVEPRRGMMVGAAALAAACVPQRTLRRFSAMLEAVPSKVSRIKGLEG